MFTDKEHRILLSAMSREEEVCKKVDEEHGEIPYQETLLYVCKCILRKISDIQHKYRWHDLRKYPSDLPEKGKRVEVATWDKETHEIKENFFTTYGMPSPFSGNRMDMWIPPFQYFDYDYEIIAWREIEQFKEGET